MKLPEDHNVSVVKLNAVFNSTSAAYKFYWFLAIIEAIEESSGGYEISKQELFVRMISNAWYTVNYFKLSFGKQDKIQQAVEFLKNHESIEVNVKKSVVYNSLLKTSSQKTIKQLNLFNGNVPHKFLSPWLGTESKKEMYRLSCENYNFPPYALYEKSILIQPDWFDYFKRNSGMLKGFCLWNLTLFLQTRNPNVPDIPNKLKRPEHRGALSKHKTLFWDIVIEELGSVDCIYTGEKLIKGSYDIEHFVPYQFVAHDLMWNLIPANPTFNREKGAKLPPMNDFFNEFYELQKNAVEIIYDLKPKNKFLEDYLTVFPSLDFNKSKYEECIQPLLTIANNNGFQWLK